MQVSRLLLFILFLGYFGVSPSVYAKTDKYRCMWQEDPSTSMVIGWNQVNGKSPILYLDTIPHGNDVDAYSVFYQPDKTVWYKRMNNHFVRLKGLRPNTVYYFIIKDSNSESRVMSFKTLPEKDEGLSIIAGGDSRNHRKYRQNANRMVAKLRPHFVMFGGDMTGSDGATSWKRWLDDWQLSIGEDGRLTPIIAARGNHERSNSVIHKIFDVPNKDIYYALSMVDGLLRAYTLNSMIAPGGKQKDWLEKDLMDHQNVRWKIAQYHHPMRPHHSRKSEKLSQQKYWAPLFYEYEMDLVVECDAHVVKTTYPIRPSKEKGSDEGFIRDDERGTVYVGEGCWGAPLRSNNDNKDWTRASGSFNQFKWIFVDHDRMEIRTVKTENPDEITGLTDESRFSIPKEIQIWSPPTGDVIVLGQSGPYENEETSFVAGQQVAEASVMSLPENSGDTWNKLLIAGFFTILILFMLLPFLPNFKGFGLLK